MPRQHSLPHGKASVVDDASHLSSIVASGGVLYGCLRFFLFYKYL